MPPNRVVALATALIGLVLALVPVIGNFDWTSTAGILAGIGAVAAIANRWLIGWQLHENNTTEPDVDTEGEPVRVPSSEHVNLA